MEHEGDGDACRWWNGLKRPGEKDLGNGGIRGRIETFQTTALLRSARILWRVLDT